MLIFGSFERDFQQI